MTDASGPRFVGRSGRGMVEAEADGLARVVDIRIDRRALTRTRATELSAHVLEAVRRVREEIRAQYRTGGAGRHA